eukprot:Pgem_evm1s17201
MLVRMFCIAIENSLTDDYVSEKVYEALMVGCLPIIYGPPQLTKHFIPHSSAVLDLAQFLDPPPQKIEDYLPIDNALLNIIGPKLVEKLEVLANNKEEYEKYFAWKRDPESLNEFFLKTTEMQKKIHSNIELHKCDLCRF